MPDSTIALTVEQWEAIAILRATARLAITAGVVALPDRVEASIRTVNAVLGHAVNGGPSSQTLSPLLLRCRQSPRWAAEEIEHLRATPQATGQHQDRPHG